MTYIEAAKQLYIKKTDIEFCIGLVKQGNEFVPKQSTPLLEALTIAIEVLEKRSKLIKYKRADNKIEEI